jgi:hypothetical protein
MLDSDFLIYDIQSIKKNQLQEGVFILLLNVKNVPPHLLIIISGKVFSISTKGVELDKPIDVYWNLIDKHNLPSIFVQLSLPDLFSLDELQEKIRLITKKFPAVDTHTVSCLMPLKEFCFEVYSTEQDNVLLVFDLLEELKNKESIEAYYHKNLDQEIKAGNYSLTKYSVHEVNEAINKSKRRII